MGVQDDDLMIGMIVCAFVWVRPFNVVGHRELPSCWDDKDVLD